MIYNKEINGVKFTLVCESWKTRNSWGHKVALYKNDYLLIGTAKVRYYNRTWERYQFQGVIKSVIFDAIERIKAAAKVAFKALHDYKVMTKNARPNLPNILQKIRLIICIMNYTECFNRSRVDRLQFLCSPFFLPRATFAPVWCLDALSGVECCPVPHLRPSGASICCQVWSVAPCHICARLVPRYAVRCGVLPRATFALVWCPTLSCYTHYSKSQILEFLQRCPLQATRYRSYRSLQILVFFILFVLYIRCKNKII